MKTYKTPVVTDVSLGTAEIDDELYEVVGVVPFLTAAAAAVGAVAAAAQAVTAAAQAFDDNYMNSPYLSTLDKVE